MKIRFVVVNKELIEVVREKTDALADAVNKGKLDLVDAITEQLSVLTESCNSLDLSEKEWRLFLEEKRAKRPELDSSYLLSGDFCKSLFPTIVSDDYVLELPIDGDDEEENFDV